MFRAYSVCLALMSCGLLQAVEPFRLRLVDLSDAWFAEGAVIRVPPNKCSEIQVLLAKPWPQETSVDRIALTMDETYPRFSRFTGVDGHLLAIRTREPLGLLTRPEHHLNALTIGEGTMQAQWTILRWDRAYIESTVVSTNGVPLDIRIDQPSGGVIAARTSTTAVHFSGEVSGNIDSRLTIAGEAVMPVPAMPGFHFDRRIVIPSDAREVIITATDSDGDSTVLVLKVLSVDAH